MQAAFLSLPWSTQMNLFAVDRDRVFGLDGGRLGLLVRALVDDRHLLPRVDVEHLGDALEERFEGLDHGPRDSAELVRMYLDDRPTDLDPLVPRQVELAADG